MTIREILKMGDPRLLRQAEGLGARPLHQTVPGATAGASPGACGVGQTQGHHRPKCAHGSVR